MADTDDSRIISPFQRGVVQEIDRQYAGAQGSVGQPPILNPYDKGGSISEKILRLEDLSQNVAVAIRGTEILYRVQGSAPGGRLVINNSVLLFPGDRVVMSRFDTLNVRRSNANDGLYGTEIESAIAGAVYLEVTDSPYVTLREKQSGMYDAELLLELQVTSAMLVGQHYMGADGTTSNNPANVPKFDFRPYRSLFGFYTNQGIDVGTSQFRINHFTTKLQSDVQGSNSQFCPAFGAGAGFGSWVCGFGFAMSANLATAGAVNNAVSSSPIMPIFGLPQLQALGGATAFTGSPNTVRIYGQRY